MYCIFMFKNRGIYYIPLFWLFEQNIEYDNNNYYYYYHYDNDKSNILPRKRNVVNSPVFEHEYAIHQIVNKF